MIVGLIFSMAETTAALAWVLPSLAVLALGGWTAARLLSTRSRVKGGAVVVPEQLLGRLLISAMAPEFREYLQASSPSVSGEGGSDLGAVIERIAYISLRPSPGHPATITLDDLAAGLALVESRMTELSKTVRDLDERAIDHDRLVWTVLSALGVVVGILAGLVGIAVGISKVVGG